MLRTERTHTFGDWHGSCQRTWCRQKAETKTIMALEWWTRPRCLFHLEKECLLSDQQGIHFEPCLAENCKGSVSTAAGSLWWSFCAQASAEKWDQTLTERLI